MAFWLGDPACEKLIIYFPGGGYCLPALPGHFSYLEALSPDIKTTYQKYQRAIPCLWACPQNPMASSVATGRYSPTVRHSET